MEDMTNGEIKVFIKMILQILKDSKDKEEAIKKNRRITKNVAILLTWKTIKGGLTTTLYLTIPYIRGCCKWITKKKRPMLKLERQEIGKRKIQKGQEKFLIGQVLELL